DALAVLEPEQVLEQDAKRERELLHPKAVLLERVEPIDVEALPVDLDTCSGPEAVGHDRILLSQGGLWTLVHAAGQTPLAEAFSASYVSSAQPVGSGRNEPNVG